METRRINYLGHLLPVFAGGADEVETLAALEDELKTISTEAYERIQSARSNRELSDEGRQNAASRLRDSARAQVANLQETAERLVRIASGRLERAQERLAGDVDERAQVEARSRVRALLANGARPAAIINTAVKVGDRHALEALAVESEWAQLGDGEAADPTLVRAWVDEALLTEGVLPDKLREVYVESKELKTTKGVVDGAVSMAYNRIDGNSTRGDALAMHYARDAATPEGR